MSIPNSSDHSANADFVASLLRSNIILLQTLLYNLENELMLFQDDYFDDTLKRAEKGIHQLRTVGSDLRNRSLVSLFAVA